MAIVNAKMLGDKSLLQRLNRLPQKLRNKVIRPALNKQASVVAKAARKLIPMGDEEPPLKNDGSPRKHLKRTIGTRSRTYGENITNIIGPKSREAPHKHLVHDGTKAHPVSIRSKIDRNIVTGWYQHPGAKANPFLKQALKNSQAEGLSVFTSALKSNIEKVAVSA